jgi:TolB-like protein/DNA-binding SARP family transcriptional activator/Flp pilus assembly protein TadD
MSDLSLALLGGFKLQDGSGEAVPVRQKRIQALLGYLAMHPGQAQRRVKLASLLWSRSDDEHARQSLRQTIRELRKSPLLADHAGLIVTPDAITMADDGFTIDVADFLRTAAEDSVASLEEALEHYQGEFLEGLDLNEPVFEDWLAETRRDLGDSALKTMLKLLDAYESDGDGEAGLRIARKILTVDRFQETAHRAVMRCLSQLGRRTDAIQHFKTCSESLKSELGVEPAHETVKLYHEIQKSTGDGQFDDSGSDSRISSSGEILTPVPQTKLTRASKFAAIAALGLIVAIVGVFAIFGPLDSKQAGWSKADGTPTDDPLLAMPQGPSIAILAFDNMSDDPGQDYFADGLVEDILTRLAQFSDLRVISRNSSFQYKGHAVDIRRIGEELGAQYVLEGSVRRSETSLRVSTQLLDSADGSHVWATSFDRDLTVEDIFQIQDVIAEGIVGALGGSFGAIRRDAATKNLQSYECYLRFVAYDVEQTASSHKASRECLEKVVEAEPRYSQALAALAIIYTEEHNLGFNPRPELYDALPRAIKTGQAAIKIDPENAFAHFALAYAYYGAGDLRKFYSFGRKSISLNPNNPTTLANLGAHMIFAGNIDDGEPFLDKALALNANYHPGWWDIAKAFAFYHRGEYEKAAVVYEKIDMPDFYFAHLWSIAVNAMAGRQSAADNSLRELDRVYPGFTIETFREAIKPYNTSVELADQLELGLRKGGLPEASSRPAIAVLPFTNMSDKPEQDYFADGITEDIITRLSHFSDLAVVARISTFKYRSSEFDVREIGQKLGAADVLEGSVQRSHETVRITAQLLDAREGTHVWAETFDRELTAASIFAVQDEITTRVASAIGGNFGAVAAARILELKTQVPEQLETYECILLGFQYERVVDADSHLAARTCLEAAVAREPDYVDALAWLGQIYLEEIWSGFNPRDDGPSSIEAAFDVLDRAVSLDPKHQKTRHALAFAHFSKGNFGQFQLEARKAIVLNPNNPGTLSEMAWMMAFSGDWDGGMELFARIQELMSEMPPWVHIVPYNFHYRNGEYALAVEDARHFAELGHWAYWLYLGQAHAQLGNADEALTVLAEVRKMEPDLSVPMLRETYDALFAEQSHIAHLIEGYEKMLAFEASANPSRPVIAVLPLTNMSDDPAQDYFADGITEDIITRLSGFQDLGVIARNSTFRYKGNTSDVRTIGGELNASHIVEGSIRTTSDRFRVTVRLINSEDGNHLWSEAYDRNRSASDIFDIQDEIATKVATTIGDEQGVISRTQAVATRLRAPSNLSSYQCVLRMHEYNRVITPAAHLVARNCIEEVVRKDPGYAIAWASLAELNADTFAIGFNPVEAPLEKAIEAAEAALALDPMNQYARWSLAYTYFQMRDLDKFLVAVDRVIEVNPNNAYWVGNVGWGLMFAGQWERGRAMIDEAISLNPYHPGWWHYPTLIHDYIRGDYIAALAEAEKLGLPDFFWSPAMFAAIYGQLGRPAEAKKAVTDLLGLNPDFVERPRFYIGAYVFSDETVEQLIGGLQKAGLEISAKAN